MVKAQKVFLWGREDILGCSFEMVLSAHKEWEVIQLLNLEDEEALVELIACEKPDVVILSLSTYKDTQSLPVRLIEKFIGLKVITVNLGNNTVEVFCRQEVKVDTMEDLLAVVEEGWSRVN